MQLRRDLRGLPVQPAHDVGEFLVALGTARKVGGLLVRLGEPIISRSGAHPAV